MRVLVVFLVSVFSSYSHATLGEKLSSAASVDAERAVLKSSSHEIETASLYKVHVLDSGLSTVREYTDTDGVVFAVTWKGMTQPDLASLFGGYYAEYLAVDQGNVGTKNPRHNNRAHKSLQTARMSMRQSGTIRSLHGHAVVPSLVPAGVNAEELP